MSAKDFHGTKWSDAIHIQSGKHVATFQYINYPPTHPEYPGYDALISLQVSTLKLVFVNRTIMGLMNYLNGFNEIISVLEYLKNPVTVKPVKPSGKFLISLCCTGHLQILFSDENGY
jgi:hypothetical protein